MIFPLTEANLAFQKGICLLFAVVSGLSSVAELLQPESVSIVTDGQIVKPSAGLAYYGSLGVELLISFAALALFWWLHQRVRNVRVSELGLQIMSKPAMTVVWSEIYSVKKALPNFMSGFYLVSLADGTDFYTPIEREPPSFSTLGQWWLDAPAPLEQLCRKHGVWAE